MISPFNAIIEYDAGDITKAIFDSVSIDEKYYPVKTSIDFKDKIVVEIESKQISHIRANLNATLRLIQASHDSINSVKI